MRFDCCSGAAPLKSHFDIAAAGRWIGRQRGCWEPTCMVAAHGHPAGRPRSRPGCACEQRPRLLSFARHLPPGRRWLRDPSQRSKAQATQHRGAPRCGPCPSGLEETPAGATLSSVCSELQESSVLRATCVPHAATRQGCKSVEESQAATRMLVSLWYSATEDRICPTDCRCRPSHTRPPKDPTRGPGASGSASRGVPHAQICTQTAS